MSTAARLSLSSSVLSDRVKKFDTYDQEPRKSQTKSMVVKQRTAQGQVAYRGETLNSLSGRSVRSNYNQTRMPPLAPTSHSPQIASTGGKEIHTNTHKLALHAVGRTTNFHNGVHDDDSGFIDYSRKPARSRLFTGAYIAASLVFFFASVVTVQTLITNRNNAQQIENVLGDSSSQTTVDEQGVVEGSGSQPAEKSVSSAALANYRVSNPENPRYLRIPSLGINSRIKQLGEKNGAIDAPWNINDVGWFEGSARPGNTTGSSLLLGHVSGWTAPGVFKNLHKLKAGEQFEIEKGNGQKVLYEVVQSESVPLDTINMGSILSAEISGEHDLKLMTCSGKYNRDTDTYEERMIVYAKVLAN